MDELKEIINIVATLDLEDRQKLMPSLNRLSDNLKQRVKTLQLVKKALEQLKLDVKYLVFDLEATKRERNELKALWENRS